MSLPNPTVRACYVCGAPARPFPEPEICTPCNLEHLDRRARALSVELTRDVEAGNITEADADAAAANMGLEDRA